MNILNTLAGIGAEQRTRRFFLVIAVLLGFLQAWTSRMDLVNDTVSYLDIGDGVWHGNWLVVVNGLWGPLYGIILGAATNLLKPSVDWEYPLVHSVIYAIFLFSLWSFDFFLREFISLRRERESADELSVPAWVWLMIGYTLFLWSALQLIQVSETNPDMLVAAFVYLTAGLLIRVKRGVAGWPAYLTMGVMLGLGYLTKLIMFPVSLICLTALFAIGKRRPVQCLAAVAAFSALAAPFIVALSLEKGRVTFGESGRYNYAVHVSHVPRTHWQGETAGCGEPLHATRQIFDHPATFEFGTPVSGAYPAWTDPSYWYDGVRCRVDVRHVVGNTATLLRTEALFFFELHGSIVAALFILFYASGRKWAILEDLLAYWFLLLPAIAALCIYALIHIEPRYLGPFLVTFLLCLYFSVHLRASEGHARLYSAIAVLLLAMYFVPIETSSLHIKAFVDDVAGRSKIDPDSPEEIAKAMYQLGLRPGDRIASLEYSLYNTSTWARLARVEIIAEVYYWPTLSESAANDFWKASPATQGMVIQAIGKTGARVIVSQMPPTPSDASGWRRVGKTDYYAYWLHRTT